MNAQKTHRVQRKRQTKRIISTMLLFVAAFLFAPLKGAGTDADEALLDQFAKSQGKDTIIFDASNIKQFWIDKSVVSKKDSFEIYLSESSNKILRSIPLKIQLANINEAQDCTVKVVSVLSDLSFSILNDNLKVISLSKKDENFLSYSVATSIFHLEDTKHLSFNVIFNSENSNMVPIKKIVLSFSENKKSTFLVSPGEYPFTKESIETSSDVSSDNEKTISITGIRSQIFSAKKILLSNNSLKTTGTIKNIGDIATTLYVGYAVYTQDQIKLDHKSYPYNKNNKILNVVSSTEGSEKILVDSYTEWKKNCYLALNVKEDMSDIPNNTFAGSIVEIKMLDNGQAEITLEKPIKNKLEKGTKVRVHGAGGAYLYTDSKVLQPGEEIVLSSTMNKDDAFLDYTKEAFSRGAYYVIPLILSYSKEPDKENTILISNYSISY